MQMDGMFDIMQLLMQLGCGAYCVMVFLSIRGAKKLPDNKFIVPQDKKPEQCRRPEAFLAEVAPKVLILGIVLTILSLILFADITLGWKNIAVDVLLMVAPLAVLVWYVVGYRKAVKKYW